MEFDFSGMAGKKVLITGGAGFIGSNLAERLIGLGAEVSIFVLPDENLERVEEMKEKIKIIQGNLKNEIDICEAIKEKNYLFHLAWQTDLKKSMAQPQEDLKNDISGLINILECCKKINPEIKIVFASTVTVVGLTDKLPVNEGVSENPLSVYESNKLIAEKYLYHVYIGNIDLGEENTICPRCKEELIRRSRFRIIDNKISDVKCAKCGLEIKGVFQ